MTNTAILPSIIQGGMGVAVSSWKLARPLRRLLAKLRGHAAEPVLPQRPRAPAIPFAVQTVADAASPPAPAAASTPST